VTRITYNTVMARMEHTLKVGFEIKFFHDPLSTSAIVAPCEVSPTLVHENSPFHSVSVPLLIASSTPRMGLRI
jgi:hypothetical protein